MPQQLRWEQKQIFHWNAFMVSSLNDHQKASYCMLGSWNSAFTISCICNQFQQDKTMKSHNRKIIYIVLVLCFLRIFHCQQNISIQVLSRTKVLIHRRRRKGSPFQYLTWFLLLTVPASLVGGWAATSNFWEVCYYMYKCLFNKIIAGTCGRGPHQGLNKGIFHTRSL